jgi:hypothetical protein
MIVIKYFKFSGIFLEVGKMNHHRFISTIQGLFVFKCVILIIVLIKTRHLSLYYERYNQFSCTQAYVPHQIS